VAKIETGSTAAASKMRAMDELITIDDVSVSPKTDSKLTADDVHTRLIGAIGSQVMFSLRRRFPSGGYETYAANLVRSSLDLKETMESLFPQACIGPVVLRLVLADEGLRMIARLRKHGLWLMQGAQDRAFASRKLRLARAQQVRTTVETRIQREINSSQGMIRIFQVWRVSASQDAILDRKCLQFQQWQKHETTRFSLVRLKQYFGHAKIFKAKTQKIQTYTRYSCQEHSTDGCDNIKV